MHAQVRTRLIGGFAHIGVVLHLFTVVVVAGPGFHEVFHLPFQQGVAALLRVNGRDSKKYRGPNGGKRCTFLIHFRTPA